LFGITAWEDALLGLHFNLREAERSPHCIYDYTVPGNLLLEGALEQSMVGVPPCMICFRFLDFDIVRGEAFVYFT
jgi:hypothetical protein